MPPLSEQDGFGVAGDIQILRRMYLGVADRYGLRTDLKVTDGFGVADEVRLRTDYI